MDRKKVQEEDTYKNKLRSIEKTKYTNLPTEQENWKTARDRYKSQKSNRNKVTEQPELT